MQWKGKVIGGVVGAILGAGPIGAAIGMLLGHQFDRESAADREEEGGDPGLISAIFFRSTFQVIGCIAKADGRVSEDEIRAARGVMHHLRLNTEQVQAAIRFFGEGKQSDFNFERPVVELRQVCHGRHDLLRYFVEIQLSAALQGAGLEGRARTIIQRIAQLLGISGFELAHMEAMLRLQRGERPAAAPSPATRLAEAYRILEIPPEATDDEVVRAYRRQMSRNHPDKLVARGLPESMQELAKEKTQQIRGAYETIRAQRDMK